MPGIGLEDDMHEKKSVRVVKNRSILRKEGDSAEPLRSKSLLSVLSKWKPLQEEFPAISDFPVTPLDRICSIPENWLEPI
jgi:hypothetical protein